MTQELFYAFTDTAAGWIGLLGSTKGLLRVTLPQKSEQEASQLLGKDINHAASSQEHFKNTIERLRVYFNGRRVDFPNKLDFTGATDFQRKVWQAARLIPYGKTQSYAWIAVKIGRPEAFRAVGQALGKNPFPIIVPCHRVLRSDGGLGGFSGGIEVKKYLLTLEGVSIKD